MALDRSRRRAIANRWGPEPERERFHHHEINGVGDSEHDCIDVVGDSEHSVGDSESRGVSYISVNAVNRDDAPNPDDEPNLRDSAEEEEEEEDEECAYCPGSPTGRQGSDLILKS